MRLIELNNVEPYDQFDVYPNANLISESGFSRVVSALKDKEFGIITAYRSEFDKKENIKRNRSLRGTLDSNKMGGYPLVGHWKECQDPNIEYDECPADMMVDAVERSYLVPKPDSMDSEQFRQIFIKLAQKFEQDGVIIRNAEGIFFMDKSGGMHKVGNKSAFNQIGQAYSQHVKKSNIPFVFEGIEVPATNFGKQLFQMAGLKTVSLTEDEIASSKKWGDIL